MMPIDAPPQPVGGTSLPARIRRHTGQIVRLAVPIMVTNTAIVAMDVIDTLMVGRYDTIEVAYQGIATAVVAPLFVCALGFLGGTQVAVANAFGAENLAECGAILRRSIPYALAMGLLGLVICLFGEPILRLLGQDEQIVQGGGMVIVILGLSLPAVLVGVACHNFFDGLGRPLIGMSVLIFANLVNIFANWVLIYGNLGAPAMGAVGSAWGTLIGRCLFVPSMALCIWFLVDRKTFGLDHWGRRLVQALSLDAIRQAWHGGSFQRKLGTAFAVSLLVEATAFEILNIFAGWLGPEEIAAYSIAFRVLGVLFMISLGIAAATGVRVGIANGRKDMRDVAIAGAVGLVMNFIVSGALAYLIIQYTRSVAMIFTTDEALISMILPVIVLFAIMLPFDTGQAVAGRALRGRGDAWVPTALHIISYGVVMLPLTWFLALPMGRGLPGLIEGAIIASVLSVTLSTARFVWLSLEDRRKPAFAAAN